MRPHLILAFCAAAMLVAGCADRAPDPAPAPPTTPPPPTPSAAPTAFPPPVQPPTAAPPPTPSAPAFPEGPYDLWTSIAGGKFAQARLEVGRLATVHWTNDDATTHSVVSTDGGFAGSGPIPPGGEFSRTFLTPGEYPFACRYHPDMTGLLVVR